MGMCSCSITGKASEVLEHLISKCPMLESLDVLIFENIDLTIRAPKLQDFCRVGYMKRLWLEETNQCDKNISPRYAMSSLEKKQQRYEEILQLLGQC